MAFYYLETNALINLKIDKIKPDIAKKSYTSQFALLEYCKNINEKSFQSRRNKLLSLIRNNVGIIYEMPIYLNGFYPKNRIFLENLEKYSDYLDFKNNTAKEMNICNVFFLILQKSLPKIIEDEKINKMNEFGKTIPHFDDLGINYGGLYFGYRIFFELIDSNKVDKNDLADLIHTDFLQNRSCKLVTGDKKITRYCNNQFKNIVISVDEYKERFYK